MQNETTFTYGKLIDISQAIQSIQSVNANSKFTYAMVRNLKTINKKLHDLFTKLQKEHPQSPEYLEYGKKISELQKEYCLKEENGAFKLTEDRKFSFETPEKSKEYNSKCDDLDAEYKKALDGEAARIKAMDATKKHEVDFTPYQVEVGYVPSMSVEVMAAIDCLITEKKTSIIT